MFGQCEDFAEVRLGFLPAGEASQRARQVVMGVAVVAIHGDQHPPAVHGFLPHFGSRIAGLGAQRVGQIPSRKFVPRRDLHRFAQQRQGFANWRVSDF